MSYVGDVKTQIEFEINVDTQTITAAKIFYKKPNGESGEWAANVGDGKIYYITQEGDLDVAGVYQLQPYIEINGGEEWKGRGSIVNLDVKEGI